MISKRAMILTVAMTALPMPGVIVLPEMSPGASDSAFTRAGGMPSYGVDGIFQDLDDQRADGRDERVGIEAFNQELDFSYRLMKDLGRIP